jgi:hypothetical protein
LNVKIRKVFKKSSWRRFPEFNKISLFKNSELLEQFIEYSKQDSICLLKALTKAQDIYINEHQVDLASV